MKDMRESDDGKQKDLVDMGMFRDQQMALSNALLQSRERTSLLESKIELLAIHHLGNETYLKDKTDAEGKSYSVHCVIVSAKDVRKFTGWKSGSMYELIKEVACDLKKKLYIFNDRERNYFVAKSLYGDVEYRKGELMIEFNPDVEYLFTNLTRNYSRIKLDIALSFTTNGGLQLYKLLKSNAFKARTPLHGEKQADCEEVSIYYRLIDLRLEMGYIDTTQEEVRREALKMHPDSDKIDLVEHRPMYRRWSDFNARVLKPGIEEINRISDIYVSKVEKKRGPRGKIEGLTITFQHNTTYYAMQEMDGAKEQGGKNPENAVSKPGRPADRVMTQDEMDNFIDIVRGYAKGLSTIECRKVAEAAGYDMMKVKKAATELESYSSKKPVANSTGFLIDAIKKGYGCGTLPQKRNFFERSYDFEDLEKRLAKNLIQKEE